MSIHEGTRPTPAIFDRFPDLGDLRQRGEVEGRNLFPRHLFLIPDGNGRWAKKINDAPPIVGHRKGTEKVLDMLRGMRELPIEIVTLWGFAADNWRRPKAEIEGLMQLFDETIKRTLPELIAENVRFIQIGRVDRIPQNLQKSIETAERETASNTGQTLCLAIDFGGRDQDVRITQKIAALMRSNPSISIEDINEAMIEDFRDGQGRIPPADLIIRTSGERRTSDAGWLAANAEFYSEPKLLPDIEMGDVVAALVDFAGRQRRFGGRPAPKT